MPLLSPNEKEHRERIATVILAAQIQAKGEFQDPMIETALRITEKLIRAINEVATK